MWQTENNDKLFVRSFVRSFVRRTHDILMFKHACIVIIILYFALKSKINIVLPIRDD